ncbi:GNAT family N-acetyltransferase [Kibdelosporangium phytohabitans]|uniref:Acetyltransferase n=1 Tax=Kibdelosporangium phytohabitans TaxID=860235 RepID=A0A0N9I094_9PSEU|nr:GNAT family N-acetyltransferase [Kibdelosporangium phytohabitans]ALG11004.1 acetyltransferase [Kibdelosporangium phytohabitans]MBE1462227.1 RimJ/RimL family protein N-acetyltransferase [Kibdelosporangium phytohabitans]
MPVLFTAVLPKGTLNALRQPVLAIDDQLALRTWRAQDVPAVRAAFDCPRIQRWHPRRMDSDEEAWEWIAGWTRQWQDEIRTSWAITHNDRAVGQIGLRNIDLEQGAAELSYWVLPEARGAGLAARAVEPMTRWCFDAVGFHRLFLKHSTENMASCRVATTAGYVPEGTLRAAMLHVDGLHDAHVHSRLRTDEGNDDGSA